MDKERNKDRINRNGQETDQNIEVCKTQRIILPGALMLEVDE